MPLITGDRKKQSEVNRQAEAARKAQEAKRRKDEAATAAALAELRDAAAHAMGADPKDVTMIVCKRGHT